ncbi:unnamed protein product [Cunninghamella echinulata]
MISPSITPPNTNSCNNLNPEVIQRSDLLEDISEFDRIDIGQRLEELPSDFQMLKVFSSLVGLVLLVAF